MTNEWYYKKEWDYHNYRGEVIGKVVRYDNSDSKQVVPFFKRDYDGSFKAGGCPSPRPLYNLPSLLEYTSRPVYVVEGEKCADVLSNYSAQGFGVIATTSMNGCGSIHKTDWTPLCFRNVVLLRDYDEAGLKWEERMVELLRSLPILPISIDIIETDYGIRKPGCDIADVFERGGDNAVSNLLCNSHRQKADIKYGRDRKRIYIEVNKPVFSSQFSSKINTKQRLEYELQCHLQDHDGWQTTKALCPFHADTHPGTFSVKLPQGAFYCFSCGNKGGNLIKFMEKKYRVTFETALAMLLR